MKTKWGENPDTAHVLPEYPRPQLIRNSYLNLNGLWSYAITGDDTPPEVFEGQILVPFSPESPLSGVERTVGPDDRLWYRRTFTLPAGFNRGRVFLNFGAVDQYAEVYINGVKACEHMGGYLPFSAEITPLLQKENTLLVLVRDWTDTSYHARGKQKMKRGGIWYTPQSGIWQTVWLESTPERYIRALTVTPVFETRELELTVHSDTDAVCTVMLAEREAFVRTNAPTRIAVPEVQPWTPETPHLCAFVVKMNADKVGSYFAMRRVEVRADDAGVPRLHLNGRPYFQTGLLDQGYWPDGLYTPPSDAAMEADIQAAKDLGFNMLRKHIKIEPLRWYYHCDRLGMLVWQDMVCGGGKYGFAAAQLPAVTGAHLPDKYYRLFGRQSRAGREEYERELNETVRTLYNCPCIVVWVPFNEGWGQFDALKMTRLLHQLDPTRPVDHASGWHDQGGGDFRSEHVYFKRYRFRRDARGRAAALTEFGGYNLRVSGHAWNSRDFGYKRMESARELADALETLYREQIFPAKKQGLAACVYTQLTDVEDELNGMLTYDREVVKIPADRMRALNSLLKDAPAEV